MLPEAGFAIAATVDEPLELAVRHFVAIDPEVADCHHRQMLETWDEQLVRGRAAHRDHSRGSLGRRMQRHLEDWLH
jgi:hypothetical protein